MLHSSLTIIAYQYPNIDCIEKERTVNVYCRRLIYLLSPYSDDRMHNHFAFLMPCVCELDMSHNENTPPLPPLLPPSTHITCYRVTVHRTTPPPPPPPLSPNSCTITSPPPSLPNILLPELGCFVLGYKMWNVQIEKDFAS